MKRGAEYRTTAELEAIAMAECRRLAQEIHGGRYAPSVSEYEQFKAYDAPSKTFLYKWHGPYANLVHSCGLEVAPHAYYYAMAKKRQATWGGLPVHSAPSCVEEGHKRDKQTSAGMGLPVQPTPRPDVWKSAKDGRWYQGLAWEVR